MHVGLINFNTRGATQEGVPPVPPIGLEYLADGLEEDGVDVSLLDLCFTPRDLWKDMIAEFSARKDLIGLTFRNIGVDSLWTVEDQSFVPVLKSVVDMVRAATKAPIAAGGQGFSIYPQQLVDRTGIDFGVVGPGESTVRHLVANLSGMKRPSLLSMPKNNVPVHKRHLIDYDLYVARGGSPAIQTKSGCPFSCNFCVEARKPLQRNSIDNSIVELKSLLQRGFEFVFVAEPEFNAHQRHAIEFCDRIIEEGLKFRWSTFLNPIPLNETLVEKMALTGCWLPCVSIPSGDDACLRAYDVRFSVDDIRRAADLFHKYGLGFTADVMFGGPEDDLASAERTIRLMEEIKPDVVGMNFGVRAYGNTSLGRLIMDKKIDCDGKLHGQIENNADLFEPIFYISDMRIRDFLCDVVDSDGRYKLLGYGDFPGINYKAEPKQIRTGPRERREVTLAG